MRIKPKTLLKTPAIATAMEAVIKLLAFDELAIYAHLTLPTDFIS